MFEENEAASPAAEESTGVSESTAVDTESSPDSEDVTASPSDAQADTDSDEAEDIYDAVRKAVDVNKPKAEGPEEDAEADTSEKAEGAEADETPESEDDESEESLPFGKHPRFKKLVGQRNELRSEVERLKPLAQEYEQVQQFMDQHELAPQEVAEAMQILALLKRDPLKAREALMPTINQLNMFSGDQLPDDLQQRVDDGYLDEESAKEVARLRAQQHHSTQRQAELQQRSQQRQQQVQGETLYRAVSDWERTISDRDPDYLKLQPLVMQATQAALAKGRPRSADEAVQLVEQAYRQVQENVKALMPKRPAQRTVTSTNSVSKSASPKPTSLLEAVTLAAQKS